MVDRKKKSKSVGAYYDDPRRRRRFRPRPAREEYPDFELGDGSKLNLDDPDVGYALNMAKRD